MKFHTGYYVTYRSGNFTPEEYSSALIEDPNQKLVLSNYKGDNWDIEWIYNPDLKGLEFVISAETFEIAQNVLYNVMCSATVSDGSITASIEPHFPHVLGSTDGVEFKSVIHLKGMPILYYSSPEVPSYFYLTAKASNNYKLQNAIIKYHLSAKIYKEQYGK